MVSSSTYMSNSPTSIKSTFISAVQFIFFCENERSPFTSILEENPKPSISCILALPYIAVSALRYSWHNSIRSMSYAMYDGSFNVVSEKTSVDINSFTLGLLIETTYIPTSKIKTISKPFAARFILFFGLSVLSFFKNPAINTTSCLSAVIYKKLLQD